MKKSFLLSVCFLWGSGMFCAAQNPISPKEVAPMYFQPGTDTGVSSPQTWSFMRYGGTTPNLYTGSVAVTIPLYTYED